MNTPLNGTVHQEPRRAPNRRVDLWWSGKHAAHGGNIQVIAEPDGWPLWTSAVVPGSTHDLTAARELVLPALYPHAARGLPVLADKGYTGAGRTSSRAAVRSWVEPGRTSETHRGKPPGSQMTCTLPPKAWCLPEYHR